MNGFDTVVLAVGSQPRNNLLKALKKEIPKVHIIGDAMKPRNALEAIHEGAVVGRKI